MGDLRLVKYNKITNINIDKFDIKMKKLLNY